MGKNLNLYVILILAPLSFPISFTFERLKQFFYAKLFVINIEKGLQLL